MGGDPSAARVVLVVVQLISTAVLKFSTRYEYTECMFVGVYLKVRYM